MEKGDPYKNLDDFLMTFALANYERIPSVWDPVDSVWRLAVASHLIEQKACFWKVLGLFTSRASGTGERYSDNVIVFGGFLHEAWLAGASEGALCRTVW